ncbi:MFS transporter [Novosphingobium pentaromativorans]|uniref:MFS transporter n=1 Tax=Novosphingobium pentaromativorans TaxID=205844 RepID=UPI00068CD2B7|nr:MFS transporter [Novosphingobium pentaromativorans]
MTVASSAGAGVAPTLTPARRWSAVVLLTFVAVFNVVDRILPAVLIEPIKHDLQLSDTVIGLITGFGFLVIYAVVGIPIARISDRGRYGVVIAVCLTLWSIMTALGGLAQNAMQFAVARMGVALGEAGSSPAAHAFISRNFTPDKRSAPLAVLTLAVPFATSIAFLAGGLIGEWLGWRQTFMLVGLCGLLLSPVVLLVLGWRKPAGFSVEGAKHPSLVDTLVHFRGSSFLLVLAGSACIGIGAYGLTSFGVAYLIRAHGFTLGEIGVEFGLLTGLLGTVGLLGLGFVADRLAARDGRWLLWSTAILMAVVALASAGAFVTSDATFAMIGLAVANITVIAYAPPVISALHRLVPSHARATASALMLFCNAIAGGLGPLAVGMISDALTPSLGPSALGLALLLVPAIHLLGAGLLALAGSWFNEQALLE